MADLRATGRYPGDADIRTLVDDLKERSPLFAELWATRDIEVQRTLTKHMTHPIAGPIELDCDFLPIAGADQRLVLYTAAPGTPSHKALQRLRETFA